LLRVLLRYLFIMKQPTHFFNLEATKNKSGEQRIFMNFSYGLKTFNHKTQTPKYTPFRFSVKRSIKKELWNDKPIYRANQTFVKMKGKDLNDHLNAIEKACYKQLEYFRRTYEKDPTIEELKQLVYENLTWKEKEEFALKITKFIDNQIEIKTKLTNNLRWDTKTANQYRALANRIKRFEERKNVVLTFESITEELYWDYFKTINEIYKEETGNYYTQTTINKEFRSLRAILNLAFLEGIKINISFTKKSLKISPYSSSHDTYLTQEQLKTIIECDTSHSKEFQHAKNYIILSSFLGLRIGDIKFLHKLTPELEIHKSESYLCVTTRIRKSKENTQELICTIPILKPVKKLLVENNNQFPSFPAEPTIRKNIKKFLKFLKFNNNVIIKTKYYLVDDISIEQKEQHEVFSPHDCRRTFITNLKQLGVQNDTIEPITHPKLKFASVLDSYDKSSLVDKAIKLIEQLNSKQSDLFKY